MRILLTTESYLPYLSGVTVSVDALARGLGALGHDVLVLAPRPAGDARPEPVGSPGPEPRYAWLASYQLPSVVPAGYRMPWPPLRTAAAREALAFRPDVVHAHSPFVTGILAQRLAGRLDVPLVFTHHTRFTDYGHYLGPLARIGARATDAYLRHFWASCAAIVAPSQDLAAEIRGRLAPTQAECVHVIPTGIDVEAIQAAEPIDPRASAGWAPDSLVVASLGRLAREKSPEIVLDAVALAAAEVPELRLLVIGGGPVEGDLRSRASRPDLAGHVHLTGALPRSEALARLRGAEVFAFASRTETQGLVLAEALAAGLPAVAVDGPGVRDSIRDGVDGVVVAAEPTEGRAERLAAGLVELAGTPRGQAMAERARADAGRFAVGRRVAQVLEVYAQLTRS
jgi:1,2-diacylglycerol 3-alpha-glucosyltransferase